MDGHTETGRAEGRSKFIALDCDFTLTADPALWQFFIRLALSRGHEVAIVTCRHDTMEHRNEIRGLLDGIQIPIYCTAMAAKNWYMSEQGIFVDIWIDDSPAAILHGAK